MSVPANRETLGREALRFVIADIDLILGDHYSGLQEDREKAFPAYSRLTSLIYMDMDAEVVCTPEQLIERAKAYGDGPEPPSPQELGLLLPAHESLHLEGCTQAGDHEGPCDV